MFLPVNINGRLYVDGLLAHAVPAAPLRQMGAEKIISIYLSAHWVKPQGPRHVSDVIGQCFSIAQERMCGPWKSASDVVLEPAIGEFGYDDFVRAPDLIRAGEAVARAALPQIMQWIPAAAPAEQKTVGAVPLPGTSIAPLLTS